MTERIDAGSLPEGLVIHQASLDVRYRDGVVYLDRCGSLMLDLKRVLGDPFTISTIPSMQYGELKSAAEWLTVRFGADSYTVSQVGPATLARFQLVGTTGWPVIENKLSLKDKVERCGVRFILVQPTKSMEESEEKVRQTGLVAVSEKGRKLIGEPIALNFAVVGKVGSAKLRVGIAGVQHQVTGDAPEKVTTVSPPHALQLDFDYYLEAQPISQSGLSEFIRDSWIHARNLAGKVISDA